MRRVFAGLSTNLGLPWRISGKEPTCSEGDTVSIPGLGRLLEKEMATYSRILVWEIPWTEKPGYTPWGPKRVGHDLATEQLQILGEFTLFGKIRLLFQQKLCHESELLDTYLGIFGQL